MKLSNFAVKNYQFTLVIFLMAILLGLNTLLTMPRSEDPDLKYPFFPIVVVYPGTSPEDLEELVVDPIEKKVHSLEGIKKIKTKISDGIAVINVEYIYKSNVEEKYQELVREVSSIRGELPSDIYSLEVKKTSPSDVNILQLALVSENASKEKMKKASEDLKKALEKLTFLKNVESSGISDEVVRVEPHIEKLATLGIPLGAVVGSIQSEIANIPGGSVDIGSKTLSVKTSGSFKDINDIANTVVYSANGTVVLLKDVANVYKTWDEATHITRLDGFKSVIVNAALKPGGNIIDAQKVYAPILESFSKSLPENIKMVKVFDQADNVGKRLKGLGIDFAIAIFLVFLTLLPLGNRASLIVMISIPLSLAIGLILLNLFGYNLNQLSIVGLVVALGLLVDDSIVVVENIERWIREGHTPKEAALKATSQIGLAVIGCTATLVIAFMPLVFLPEGSGDFIRSLPMAVLLAIIASMLVSLTVIPFLSSKILKNHASSEGNVFLQSLKKGIHVTYAPLLEKALQKPKATIVIAAVIFAGSVALVPVIGFSLFPPSEKPQLMVNVYAPLQTSLKGTDSIAHDVEKRVAQIPEIKHVSSNIGKGNPQVYYNVMQENQRPDFAQLFVQLKDDTKEDRKLDIIEELRNNFKDYPEAKVEVKNFEQGPPVLAPVEIRIFGDNLDTLRSLAARVEKKLESISGTIYINNPVSLLKTDVKVDINRDKANMLGVSTVDIDRTVRLAVAGLQVGQFNNTDGTDYKVVVTSQRGEKATMEVLNNLFVNNRQGVAIPLNQLATVHFDKSPLTINHQNKVRTVSVTAFVAKGYRNDQVIAASEKAVKEISFPTGYTFTMGGEVESREESFGGFGSIILATVFLFIAVLILEFKTFKSTLIVLSVIPLGIVGAAIALLLTGNTLSFVATVGLIALAGIEVKNSILLVDFTNQLRKDGMELNEAIRTAGEIRFLPIILTSLTAIGGLIPIALSNNPLISPLAIVLIGGLISSTLLSRIVTPVIYKLIPPKIEQ